MIILILMIILALFTPPLLKGKLDGIIYLDDDVQPEKYKKVTIKKEVEEASKDLDGVGEPDKGDIDKAEEMLRKIHEE